MVSKAPQLTKGYSKADVTAAFALVGVQCGGTPPPVGGVLEKGVAKTGLAGASGSTVNYTYDAPSDAGTVTITMSGGSGDADLYTKKGSAPTTSSYDCRPYASGNNETCTGNGSGTYHVMVRGYSSYSGVSLVADHTTSGGGGGSDSGSASNLSQSTGNWHRESAISIPAGVSSFEATISGGTGDADLYTRSGSAPTTSSYDCRPYRSGNSETCTHNNPAAGDWHIGIRAYSSFSGVNLTWSYQ